MKKQIVFYALLFLLIVGISYATTKIAPFHTPMHEDKGVCLLEKYLNLAEPQKTEFHNLNQSFQQKIAKLNGELSYELEGLLFDTPTDKYQLNQKVDEICTHQTELQRQVLYHLLAMKRILTPEQQKKCFDLIIERMCPDACGHPTDQKCKCKDAK